MTDTEDRGKDLNDAIETLYRQSDMIFRICRLNLKNQADAEDVFQEVFIRLMRFEGTFENEEHQKAWLCRVAINLCKDWQRSFWRRKVSSMEVHAEIDNKAGAESAEQHDLDLLAAVRALPANMRNVMHLHYFEGYSVPEIAVILNRKPNTLYSDMNRARKRLKDELGESEDAFKL